MPDNLRHRHAGPWSARYGMAVQSRRARNASGLHGAGLIMGEHLARSVRGISCAPPQVSAQDALTTPRAS